MIPVKLAKMVIFYRQIPIPVRILVIVMSGNQQVIKSVNHVMRNV